MILPYPPHPFEVRVYPSTGFSNRIPQISRTHEDSNTTGFDTAVSREVRRDVG